MTNGWGQQKNLPLHSLAYYFRGSSGSRRKLGERGPQVSLPLKLLTTWRWALYCLKKAVLAGQVSHVSWCCLWRLWNTAAYEKRNWSELFKLVEPNLVLPCHFSPGGLWSPNAELRPLPGLLHLLRIYEANPSAVLGTKRILFSIVCPSPPPLQLVVIVATRKRTGSAGKCFTVKVKTLSSGKKWSQF